MDWGCNGLEELFASECAIVFNQTGDVIQRSATGQFAMSMYVVSLRTFGTIVADTSIFWNLI